MQQQLEQACQERLDSHLQEAAHTLLGRMKDRSVWSFFDECWSLLPAEQGAASEGGQRSISCGAVTILP